MKICLKCSYKVKEHDAKIYFMHEWLKNWRGTINSRWSGIQRKEVRILGLHGCFYLKSRYLCGLTPLQNLDWSGFFVSKLSNLMIKNLNWYILIRDTTFHGHTLKWYYGCWITHTVLQKHDVKDWMHWH